MSLATSLSKNDQSVLLTILTNGEGAAIDHASQNKKRITIDLQLKPDQNIDDVDLVEALVNQEKDAIKLIENNQDYLKAQEIFHSIIKQQPNYASVYNNLAQLQRIIMDNSQNPNNQDELDSIINNLTKCISLAEPHETDDEIRVSKMQATILQNAYSQLGAVYLRKAELNPLSKWDYEQKASEALYCAGEYGNQMAKQLSLKINPYAKLCGNMVQEALAREYQTMYS